MSQPNVHRRVHTQSRFSKLKQAKPTGYLELLGRLLDIGVKLSAAVGFLILFLFWNDIGYIPFTDASAFAISSAAAVSTATLLVLGSSVIVGLAYFGRYVFGVRLKAKGQKAMLGGFSLCFGISLLSYASWFLTAPHWYHRIEIPCFLVSAVILAVGLWRGYVCELFAGTRKKVALFFLPLWTLFSVVSSWLTAVVFDWKHYSYGNSLYLCGFFVVFIGNFVTWLLLSSEKDAFLSNQKWLLPFLAGVILLFLLNFGLPRVVFARFHFAYVLCRRGSVVVREPAYQKLLSRFDQLRTDPKDADGNYRLRNCNVELLSKLGSETVLQCFPINQSSKNFRVQISTTDLVDYDAL